MSRDFHALQDILRKTKDHGIDLTVPHGVTIGSKTYPAINKSLVLSANWGDEGHSFQIPLENGHKVQFTYRTEGPDKKAYAHTHVLYPTQTGEWGMPNSPDGGIEQHFAPFDSVHDKIKKHSLEKARGLRVGKFGFAVQDVPDDELQEHYEIGNKARQKRIEDYPSETDKEHARHPNLIKVHKTFSGSPNKRWMYNIKTEQMTEVR
jgi:hypothetical protein